MMIKKFKNFISESKKPFDIIKDMMSKGKKIDGELYTLVSNDINIVKYLIESGMDINLEKGLPLLSAAKSNNKELANLLIKNGADILIDNKKVLKVVCKLGKNDMLEFLISKLYRNSVYKDPNFYNTLKSFVESSESISGESKKETLDLINSLSNKNCRK